MTLAAHIRASIRGLLVGALLLCVVIVAEMFERAIAEDLESHEGFEEERLRRKRAAREARARCKS